MKVLVFPDPGQVFTHVQAAIIDDEGQFQEAKTPEEAGMLAATKRAVEDLQRGRSPFRDMMVGAGVYSVEATGSFSIRRLA